MYLVLVKRDLAKVVQWWGFLKINFCGKKPSIAHNFFNFKDILDLQKKGSLWCVDCNYKEKEVMQRHFKWRGLITN